MIDWVVALPEVGAEALAELNAYTGPVTAHADHVIHRWAEDDAWLRANAETGAGILTFLSTRGAIQPWNVEQAADLLTVALESGAPSHGVLAAAEPLIVVGGDKIRALVARLRS